MEQAVVVKSEMHSNGEILLFYVDENGGNEEGVLTTVQNIENQAIELQQDSSFILSDDGPAVLSEDIHIPQSSTPNDIWTGEDIKRLLMFYNDNKQIFISGTTKKKHLWTVACKTMLIGKHPNSCEVQLNALRDKYFEYMRSYIQKGVYVEWPYFEICHQVFHNGSDKPFEIYQDPNKSELYEAPILIPSNDNNILAINKNKKCDEKVELMLNSYLKYKKNFQQEYRRKGLWEAVAMELGEEDGEYWQKRFLNYKQHYLRLLDKRQRDGPETINWPYMELFDKIFENDEDFNKRYMEQEYKANDTKVIIPEAPRLDWNMTEMTVLVKYCYDCFDEFQDRTIPNSFLWNEIGRLLDKTADACKEKYEQMKDTHLNKYIEGDYDIRTRKPISILYDNIISKEIEFQMFKLRNIPEESEEWKTNELDELVQFFYENIEMYKDLICHYVCWAAIVKKLKRNLHSCKGQWDDLVALYKTILNDKKENPDMQIDWRYIELFDRIFDYGMDINLLTGYDKLETPIVDTEKVGVKKVKIKNEDANENYTEDEESFDERGFTKRTKHHSGDSKAFKILEYYQKNKDKFSTTNRNKHSLWEVLAKQIGISATQCAHRFRNLKQVYTSYVQREINKPEMPILWPYYALCKKVFGYRAIKNKLKNGKHDFDDSEEWTPREIKHLINYFSQNVNEIDNNIDDSSKWTDLTSLISKSVASCKGKFLELRKCYRKLKTMRSRNPDVKISWKYFNMFDQIYEAKEKNGVESMNVDTLINYMNEDKNGQEDDEFECIIVIPEGEDIENAQIIIQDHSNEENLPTNETEKILDKKVLIKWTKRTKKQLLIHYINYIRSHKGKKIKPKDMWTEIASKLPNKTVVSCKKMFKKLKSDHQMVNDNPDAKKSTYNDLLEKIMRLKPKFVKNKQRRTSKDDKIYKDVVLPDEKIVEALRYYLTHIEDFVSPKYEKKYLWIELANHVNEPVSKVYNKINYMKQFYNSETDEVAGKKTNFGDLLKEIIAKEIAIRLIMESVSLPVIEESNDEETWTDEEIEKLLEWYLSNLEKFKNPKYVRSYLWMEVSGILKKSALICSKKMSEIRTQYRNMVRGTPNELSGWRFLELCQKIYGTGKKVNLSDNQPVTLGQSNTVP